MLTTQTRASNPGRIMLPEGQNGWSIPAGFSQIFKLYVIDQYELLSQAKTISGNNTP